MNEPLEPRQIPNSAGDINERLKRRFDMTNLGRIESAHRIINTHLYSPEAKRSFMRMFHPMQVNVHFITSIARMGLPSDMVERAESDLLTMLETVSTTMDKGTARLEKKLTSKDIRELAKYHLPPVSQGVPVFSGFGRRYLELINKFDHLMLMVETLFVYEVIDNTEAAALKAEFKKPIRNVAQAARLTRNRLYRAFRERATDEPAGHDFLDRADRDGDDDAGELAGQPDGAPSTQGDGAPVAVDVAELAGIAHGDAQ